MPLQKLEGEGGKSVKKLMNKISLSTKVKKPKNKRRGNIWYLIKSYIPTP
jgi:hypothetical protein